MSFTSVLGKIFGDIQKGIQIFEGIEPLAYPLIPPGAQATVSAITDDLTMVGNAVTNAQAVVAALAQPGATPASVVAAALPLVTNVISESELVAGKNIADEALFSKACQEFAQATVDLLNSLQAPKKSS